MGVVVLEVDGAEGKGLDVVPVVLIRLVGSPAVDSLLMRGAVGKVAKREWVGRSAGAGVGIAEAELQDFGAVVEVPVSPDGVGCVLIDDLEEGPGRAEREVDWSLFHESCGCFLTQSYAETGVLKGLEVMKSYFTGRMVWSIMIAQVGIAPVFVHRTRSQRRIGGVGLSTKKQR